MEKFLTDRWYHLYRFKDRLWTVCNIQKSSRATEDCIWLWVEDCNPQIMVSDAKKLWIPTDDNEVWWIDFKVPKEVVLTTRMEINKEQAKELVLKLNRFIETWDIKETPEEH